MITHLFSFARGLSAAAVTLLLLLLSPNVNAVTRLYLYSSRARALLYPAALYPLYKRRPIDFHALNARQRLRRHFIFR